MPTGSRKASALGWPDCMTGHATGGLRFRSGPSPEDQREAGQRPAGPGCRTDRCGAARPAAAASGWPGPAGQASSGWRAGPWSRWPLRRGRHGRRRCGGRRRRLRHRHARVAAEAERRPAVRSLSGDDAEHAETVTRCQFGRHDERSPVLAVVRRRRLGAAQVEPDLAVERDDAVRHPLQLGLGEVGLVPPETHLHGLARLQRSTGPGRWCARRPPGGRSATSAQNDRRPLRRRRPQRRPGPVGPTTTSPSRLRSWPPGAAALPRPATQFLEAVPVLIEAGTLALSYAALR